MTDEHNQLLRLAEAILFAAKEPLSEELIAQRMPTDTDVGALLGKLQQLYENRGLNLVRPGGKWAFRTAPDLASKLDLEREVPRRISRAGVETLAIISYHQPITRAEIEEIRGVAVNRGTLDVLMECGWIKPGRRRETPGRPVTWVSTQPFLDHFGLESLKDLPGLAELRDSGLLEKQAALNVYGVQAGEAADEAAAAPALGLDMDDGEYEPLSQDDAVEDEAQNENEPEAAMTPRDMAS